MKSGSDKAWKDCRYGVNVKCEIFPREERIVKTSKKFEIILK